MGTVKVNSTPILLEHTSQDKSMKIRLEYIFTSGLRMYPFKKGYDKHYPATIQCLLFINNRFIFCGEAVKHSQDVYNKRLGMMLATKKALTKLNARDLRKQIWEKFDRLDFN